MTFTELLTEHKDTTNHDVGPNVGCPIKAMLIADETTIAFLFAPGHCCDMTRLIAFSKSMLSEAKTILTFSGDSLDTCYIYRNNCWKAVMLWRKEESRN